MRACLLLAAGLVAATAAESAPARFRRPGALALSENGAWLYVANQRSGTISVIETAQHQVTAEHAVGQRLADLAAMPDGKHLLAVDEAAGELIVLFQGGSQVEVRGRLAVGRTPVSVCALDARRCSILLRWPRRVVIAEWQPAPRIIKTLDLPFAPGRQIAVQEGERLVVADAFGGQLALVDTRRAVVDSIRSLPVHNIRGLAFHDGRLLLTHQHLSALAPTTRDDVHWGNVITNQLRSLRLAAFLSPDADVRDGEDRQPLGEVDRGAGDPAGVAVTPDGTILVSIAGTGEVALRKKGDTHWSRLAVGKRPTAVSMSPGGKRAYVANTLSDSLSVIDVAGRKVIQEISLGSQPKPGPAERGEQLFFDAQLSLEGWFSCHSCHSDGHSNGRLADTLGDGSFGAPKRVLSLLGIEDTPPYAWNGSMIDLETQIRKSVATTMRGRPLTEAQTTDLAAYLRTLPPPPGLAVARGELDGPKIERGRDVFRKHGCADCHAPPAYTSPRTYGVGLVDEVGAKTFNPPSLRGVSQGGPYFHDRRAATLEDVFTRYRHQLTGDLTAAELAELVSFLQSL